MDEIYLEVKTLILGDKSIAFYIAAFFFSCLAILLSLYVRGKSKYKQSTDTPPVFSWYFLIWDNTKRIVSGMIVMFLLYRFDAVEWVAKIVGGSMEAAVGVGFFVSIGVDRAIQWLQSRFDFLNMDRDKLPTKPL